MIFTGGGGGGGKGGGGVGGGGGGGVERGEGDMVMRCTSGSQAFGLEYTIRSATYCTVPDTCGL